MWKIGVFAALFLATAAWGQSTTAGRQLTARELFYAAAEQPAAKTAPALPAVKPAVAAEAKTSRKTARANSPRRDPATAPPAPREDGAVTVARRPAETAPADYVPATYSQGERKTIPLGLRYTILKLVDGRMTEVAPDATFRAGDRIQVSVEANDTGYLYIVHQGTSGTWKPLFPSAEIAEGNNRIEKGRTYVMPPKSRFYFDEQAGEEKLFIVFSRQPEADLEKLVYKLQDGGRPEAPAPAAEPAAPKHAVPVMLASNMQIDDSLVGRLRNVYARDLVVEKVDDDTETAAAGGRREKAVYVVNPGDTADARVVADVRLTHR